MTGKPETPPPPPPGGPTHPPNKPGLDEQSPWMSVKEAAAYARRHPKTIAAALRLYRNSQARKGLRGAQPNGPNSAWAIRRADVDRWCAGETPLRPPRGLRAVS